MRLNIVMTKLIDRMQSGFMKGRLMAENLQKLHKVIEYCYYNQHPGLVISIDFHKAFDSVEWQAIHLVLKKYEFGEPFINMIKPMYKHILSMVINNGFWSDWFSPSRATRQGDPISPLIFDLVIEVLGARLRQNE